MSAAAERASQGRGTHRKSEWLVERMRRSPFTTVVAALVLITDLVDAAFDLAATPGGGASAGGRHTPWPIHATLTAIGGLTALAVTVAAVVLILGAAERLLGWRRALLAFVLTTVVGSLVTALVVAAVDGFAVGPVFLGRLASFDPWSAVVGTIATASAFAGALWRRRTRIIALAVAATLLLYAGRSSDLSLAISAITGVVLGELLRSGPRRVGWARSSHREGRVLLSAVVLAYAIGPVAALVARARVGLLTPVVMVLEGGGTDLTAACSVRDVTTGCVQSLSSFHLAGPTGFVLGVAPLVALVVGGFGLARGSRIALWTVVTVDLVTGFSAATFYGVVPSATEAAIAGRPSAEHVVVAVSIVASVILPLGTAVALILRRDDFRVRTTRVRLRVFVAVVAGTAVVLGGVVTAIAFVVGVASIDPVRMGLAVLGPLTPAAVLAAAEHAHPVLRVAVDVAGPLEWFVLALALARAIRPVRASVVGDPAARARRLVHRGGDGFAWMATWPDNELWFSDDGRAGFAYRRTGRIAVTLGGPFGEADAVDRAWTSFARFCDDAGWSAVFYAVDPSVVEPLRRRGWSTLPVASDADIDPSTWTLSGKRKQDVRTAVNRADREGITAVWGVWSSMPPARIRQIVALSEEWIAERDLPEMGFTLGGLDEMRDPEVRTLVAEDASGSVLAVTSWLPSYRDDRLVGWTLDVMRRRPDAPNGVMEFLVAEAVRRAQDDGLERIGLSAAPLAQVDRDASPSVLELVGEVLEPVYGFRSLLRFKAKFGPVFAPLVMAYPDPVALPAIGVAIARAYLPGLRVRQAASLALRQDAGR